MYSECLYTVKYNNSLSSLFLSSVGLKQGCPLSSILSNIFQNDHHEIFNDSCFPISLGDIKLNSL